MDEIKRLGYPVLIIFLSALITRFLEMYLVMDYSAQIIKLIVVGSLFLFGTSLNKSRKRRTSSVFKKTIAILLTLLLLCMQFGLFHIPAFSHLLSYFGVDAFFINMLYIFSGYLFVD